MEEQEFLRAGAMLVTSTRIEIAGQTFSVRNVGSVKVTTPGRPWLAGLVGLFGVGLAAQEATRWGGVLVLGAAAAWIWQRMRQKSLVLVSGGGEVVALTSTNGAAVEELRAAISKAISGR